jgi:hypothetical protein
MRRSARAAEVPQHQRRGLRRHRRRILGGARSTVAQQKAEMGWMAVERIAAALDDRRTLTRPRRSASR